MHKTFIGSAQDQLQKSRFCEPLGGDFCSIYYDDESERLVIDLIEGNFASDPGDVSFTELQRKICMSVKEGGAISVRWLEYLETPMNPYANGHWTIADRDV